MAKVLVPLAKGFEELEAVTIIDLLRRAEIEVTVAGLDEGPIVASRGVVMLADVSLDQALTQDYDMVVLPGGAGGSDVLNADSRIHDLLKKMADSERFTAAICAAPKVLANAGVIEGRIVTGFPGVLEALPQQDFSLSSDAVVTDGKIVTSRGPGTAIDFALTLIVHLVSVAKRDEVEAQLKR
jgi:4-methyl-5(b-hydroxyethyl)-thiazole monophosphate biosynthesis